MGLLLALLSALTLLPSTAMATTTQSCLQPGYIICGGDGTPPTSTAPPTGGTPADFAVAQELAAIPGVYAGLADGHCCIVAVRPGTTPPDLAAFQLTVYPPYSYNTCRYTQTWYQQAQYAGEAEYGVDNHLGAEAGASPSAPFFFPSTSRGSALADAGTTTWFGGGGLPTGTTVNVQLPWHVRGQLYANADRGGPFAVLQGSAGASYTFNIGWLDPTLTGSGAKTMALTQTVTVDQTSLNNPQIQSVSRDYSDDVSNPWQLNFAQEGTEQRSAYIEILVDAVANSVPAAGASANSDFFSGNITTRSGPQTWLDMEEWYWTIPGGVYITDCGHA
jgi:hypothetical protein